MKKSAIFGLLLLPGLLCYGQEQRQQPPAARPQAPAAGQVQRMPEDSTIRMTHFQTEIWEPEVPMVQPAAQIGDPPADAIILFGMRRSLFMSGRRVLVHGQSGDLS